LNPTSKPHVSVAGGTAVGLLLRVDRPPAPGETVLANDMVYIDGGKAAGQAVGVARLGLRTSLLSALGDDALATRLRTLLDREGVDCTGVTTIEGAGTMLGIVVIDADGENQIVVALNALGMLTVDHIKANEETIADSDICLVSLEIPIAAAEETLRLARKHGVTTILNPAPAPTEEDGRSLVALSDYITPNQTEAVALTGMEGDPETLSRELLERGAGAVAMTLGAEGALYVSPEGSNRIPSPVVDPADIVDTAGAGDAFNAAFAVALAKGASPLDACRWGCEAGSRIVQGPGFMEALHTWEGFTVG